VVVVAPRAARGSLQRLSRWTTSGGKFGLALRGLRGDSSGLGRFVGRGLQRARVWARLEALDLDGIGRLSLQIECYRTLGGLTGESCGNGRASSWRSCKGLASGCEGLAVLASRHTSTGPPPSDQGLGGARRLLTSPQGCVWYLCNGTWHKSRPRADGRAPRAECVQILATLALKASFCRHCATALLSGRCTEDSASSDQDSGASTSYNPAGAPSCGLNR
jgi:hypothetical protein